MSKNIVIAGLFLVFGWLSIKPVWAIIPDGVRKFPLIPFEMIDCSNENFAETHPEWGPVGSWRDFGLDAPACKTSASREAVTKFITDAKTKLITLPTEEKIPKPVGVGWRATKDNLNQWSFLNDPSFTNLAFILAESPSLYGEVTGGYTTIGGVWVEDTFNWAKEIMGPISQAFTDIMIFFQACDKGAELLGLAVQGGYKNIGVKCNGWYYDMNNAMKHRDNRPSSVKPCRLAEEYLDGGAMGMVGIFSPVRMVGFEPKMGVSTEQWYWNIMQTFSFHLDFLDIDTPDLDKLASLKDLYGIDMMKFIYDHQGKTLAETPDVWVVMRETMVSRVPECSEDENGNPVSSPQGCDCCWANNNNSAKYGWTCSGPQRGNLSYWLYQKDDLAGGQSVVVRQDQLPALAKNHPYGQYTARRTDYSTGNPYFYFDVDDRWQAGQRGNFKIAISLWNPGSGSFSLEYYDTAGILIRREVNKNSDPTKANKWVDYDLEVNNAVFNNSFGGKADFRIDSGTDDDEIIHRVVVTPMGNNDCADRINGNLNCDPAGLINQPDLDLLINSWGTGASDLNNDGQTDEKEITILLKNWTI